METAVKLGTYILHPTFLALANDVTRESGEALQQPQRLVRPGEPRQLTSPSWDKTSQSLTNGIKTPVITP
ncbi:hypothetical protein QF027_000130 [Streptomyces canus]|nr:hypothetical protein [Streptomyces canus]